MIRSRQVGAGEEGFAMALFRDDYQISREVFRERVAEARCSWMLDDSAIRDRYCRAFIKPDVLERAERDIAEFDLVTKYDFMFANVLRKGQNKHDKKRTKKVSKPRYATTTKDEATVSPAETSSQAPPTITAAATTHNHNLT